MGEAETRTDEDDLESESATFGGVGVETCLGRTSFDLCMLACKFTEVFSYECVIRHYAIVYCFVYMMYGICVGVLYTSYVP